VVAVCIISGAKDHRLVWDWIDRNRLLHHPVEKLSSVFGASPIEPEGEFVEIEFQVLRTDRPLVSAQHPDTSKSASI
jgi:hypothetical protein